MKNNTQKVALFDMDGTLTLPRKKISADTITALAAVSTQAKIAVVTGSPIEYVIDQLDSLWGSMGINPENITLMPCNGTKLYKWSKVSNCFVQEYTKDLKKHIDSKDCHYEKKTEKTKIFVRNRVFSPCSTKKKFFRQKS